MAIPDADGCLQNWKLGVAVLGLFTCTLAQIASSSVAFNLPLTYPRRGWSIISAAGKIGPSNSIRRIENIEDPLLTITTFNVLAPIFKRVGMDDRRESEFRDAYLKRNAAILEHLKVCMIFEQVQDTSTVQAHSTQSQHASLSSNAWSPVCVTYPRLIKLNLLVTTIVVECHPCGHGLLIQQWIVHELFEGRAALTL